MNRLWLLPVLCCTLAGCGGSGDRREREKAIITVVKTYVRAVYGGHFATACATLSPAAQRDVMALVARSAPVPPPTSCAGAYRALLMIGSLDIATSGVMDRARTEQVTTDPAVRVVRLQSSEAVASVEGSVKTVRLELSDGKWRIARLDFSDL
jgi:hypothetical protein